MENTYLSPQISQGAMLIKKWVMKAVVQKTISFLPKSQQINYWFQKHVTKGVFLTDEYFEDKLIHFSKHAGYFAADQADPLHQKNIYELGTGWYPVIPICFFLSGARLVTTIDIAPLMTKENLRTTIDYFLSYKDFNKWNVEDHFLSTRWEMLRSIQERWDGQDLDDILEILQIRYLIADARKAPIAEKEIDFIVSNNVFEHIYPSVLRDILVDFKRVISPGGMMSHFIDMSDHFAHFDKSINIYHFLRFSPTQWKMIDNDIQPQNRWRLKDYKRLYEELGIPIVREEVRPGNRLALQEINVDESFGDYTFEELAISHAYLFT